MTKEQAIEWGEKILVAEISGDWSDSLECIECADLFEAVRIMLGLARAAK